MTPNPYDTPEARLRRLVRLVREACALHDDYLDDSTPACIEIAMETLAAAVADEPED